MKKSELLVMAALIVTVLMGLWLTTQSMIVSLWVGGVAIITGIILLGIYSGKQSRQLKELKEQDGLYDEGHFYRISLLTWVPIYLVLGLLLLKYKGEWYQALGNLQILFNVVFLMIPPRLIFQYFKHKYKDRIRPRPPMPLAAKIGNAIMLGISIVYVAYEIYRFAVGKPW